MYISLFIHEILMTSNIFRWISVFIILCYKHENSKLLYDIDSDMDFLVDISIIFNLIFMSFVNMFRWSIWLGVDLGPGLADLSFGLCLAKLHLLIKKTIYISFSEGPDF